MFHRMYIFDSFSFIDQWNNGLARHQNVRIERVAIATIGIESIAVWSSYSHRSPLLLLQGVVVFHGNEANNKLCTPENEFLEFSKLNLMTISHTHT